LNQSPITKSPRPFHILTKPIGPICNLDCKYCFYLEKEALYPGENQWRMSDAVLEEYVRQYIRSQPVDEINFAWQGGEPTLLGVDFFRKSVALQKKFAGGKIISNAIQTNGTLLDDEWCKFLAANNFLVGLSIDGPAEMHDAYRVDKRQQPTFDKVMRGLDLLKKHRVEFNTLTVVNRLNSQSPLDVYRFLKSIGGQYLQFIPLVERAAIGKSQSTGLIFAEPPLSHDQSPRTSPNAGTTSPSPPQSGGLSLLGKQRKESAKRRAEQAGASESLGRGEVVLRAQGENPTNFVTEWSVESEQYGHFLCAIFDEWIRHDVGTTFVQLFDTALGNWMGLGSSLCVFAEKCGAALAVEHNGDLYSCDHYVYPRYKLGNVMNQSLGAMVNSPPQIKFGNDKFDSLPKYCRECEVRFACNGECPKHRFISTPDGEPGLNYLCAAYKKFFTHIDPHMKTMEKLLRQDRAPAEIMSML
jgi:uncharacterized protein